MFALETIALPSGPTVAIALDGRHIPLTAGARLGLPIANTSLFALLASWDETWPKIAQLAARATAEDAIHGAQAIPQFGAARKVLCAGANYYKHLAEMNVAFDKTPNKPPFFFLKPPGALVGPGRTVPVDPAIAQNLIARGHDVIGYRRSASDALTRAGGRAASHPHELAAADVILSVLPSAAALDDVMTGAHGLLAALEPRHTVSELSSYPLAVKERYRTLLADRGATLIDEFRGNRMLERVRLEAEHQVTFTRLSGPVLGTILNVIDQDQTGELHLRFAFNSTSPASSPAAPTSSTTRPRCRRRASSRSTPRSPRSARCTRSVASRWSTSRCAPGSPITWPASSTATSSAPRTPITPSAASCGMRWSRTSRS